MEHCAGCNRRNARAGRPQISFSHFADAAGWAIKAIIMTATMDITRERIAPYVLPEPSVGVIP